jgi:hypothetical protein
VLEDISVLLTDEEENTMGNVTKWAWRAGMVVVFGVPAIILGGLAWELFQKWTAVIVFEIVLLFLLSWVLAKGDKKAPAHH